MASRNLVLGLAFALAVLLATGPASQAAEPITKGSATGLPVPRYVSLKSDRVNLREGPSKDNRTRWVFQRAGLPVEIIAEFETWRRIRDSEGADGWVLHSLLSGRRTALVSPWMKTGTVPLYTKANVKAELAAELQPGVLGQIKSCDGQWCRLAGPGFDGFVQQDRLWGVYPQEKVD